MHALVIGGTRFIGRHTVDDLLDRGDDVTLFNRGNHENPFTDHDRVDHVEGDRTNDSALEAAAMTADPDVVFDFVAYHPRDVRAATRIFEDVDAYVYVSSGAAYVREELPKREGETPLCECTQQQATDDTMETYGNRKAEGDRAVFAAADRGVNALSVRPTVVYGPYDWTERVDYWIDRVAAHDRIVVPGDGTYLMHYVYVEDVARSLLLVADEGEAGEAYNAADRRLVTLDRLIGLIADALDTDVEVVRASERELSTAGIGATDFPLYEGYAHVLDTEKLASLDWDSTPPDAGMERTVEEHLESDRDGREIGPDRGDEERVLGVLDTIR